MPARKPVKRDKEKKYTFEIGAESKKVHALADEVMGIECQPVNRNAAGSIPDQVTCLGFGPGP